MQNHLLFPVCSLISVLRFSKQMQIDLMICISRSFLSIISFAILVKDFFFSKRHLFPKAKVINIGNIKICSNEERDEFIMWL